MTERWILLTVPHNSFFSRIWKFVLPVLIGLLILVSAIHADPAINNSTTFIGGSVVNQVADVRPSATNENLMPSPPLRITISGKITTPDGTPVEGATIRTEFFMTYDTRSVAVESEADGSYRINDAHGFNQKISVGKNGYVYVTKEMTFKQNVNTVDFILEPTTKPALGFTSVLCLVAIVGTLLIICRKNPGVEYPE